MERSQSVEIPRSAADVARELAKASAGRVAYAAVHEGAAHGREREGWYLGLAVEREPGYHQLRPGFGPWATHGECQAEAEQLNAALGHTEKDAAMIVLSTMGRGGVCR